MSLSLYTCTQHPTLNLFAAILQDEAVKLADVLVVIMY